MAVWTVGCLVVTFIFSATAVDWDVYTELDRYIDRDDGVWDYVELARHELDDCTIHVLNMTSLRWMDEVYTSNPIWWHFLTIFVPKNPVIYDAAMLGIGSGGQSMAIPAPGDYIVDKFGNHSVNMGAITANLYLIPFQAIIVENSSVPRTEDGIIAWSWKRYIEDPSETPLAEQVVLMPMTKASKVAVDTLFQFVSNNHPEFYLTKVFPTGYSKRGWTTWLLGCVDRRVFGMAPTVFDLLNLQDNLEHHNRALGGWSWAFFQYWLEDVARYLYHPRMPDLMMISDPYYFKERLTMPKVIMLATSDQFFPPDGSHYFFDDIPEPKFMQLWENDDHGLGDHQPQRDHNLEGFFLTTYYNLELPTIWSVRSEDETSGRIDVYASPAPTRLSAWLSDTVNDTCQPEKNDTCRRDFRKQELEGAMETVWIEQPVTNTGLNQWMVEFDKRTDFGHRGFFIEMYYPGANDYELRFTTEIHIIPDEFPYPQCQSEDECQGQLV